MSSRGLSACSRFSIGVDQLQLPDTVSEDHPTGWAQAVASTFPQPPDRCETDLMASHPIHVVCGWIGNAPKVALAHSLQTLDEGFAKAVQM